MAGKIWPLRLVCNSPHCSWLLLPFWDEGGCEEGFRWDCGTGEDPRIPEPQSQSCCCLRLRDAAALLSWLNPLRVRWALGGNRGLQSVWVRHSLWKLQIFRACLPEILLLLLQQNLGEQLDTARAGPRAFSLVPLFGREDPGLTLGPCCNPFLSSILCLADGHFEWQDVDLPGVILNYWAWNVVLSPVQRA